MCKVLLKTKIGEAGAVGGRVCTVESWGPLSFKAPKDTTVTQFRKLGLGGVGRPIFNYQYSKLKYVLHHD